MKERPILFSAPMVRALLDGSKTQTRRAMKTQLVYGDVCGLFPAWYLPTGPESGILYPNGKERILSMCPYGQPGDRLWVRETYADIGCRLTYRADADDGAHCQVKKWTPAIHMFRADSRILLEIVSVRVERLNDVSEADARAEGVKRDRAGGHFIDGTDARYAAAVGAPASEAFAALWNGINGAGSWEANPWCWCITFRRVAP